MGVLAGLMLASAAAPESLRGSRRAMDEQVRVARAHDYTYIRDVAQLRRFVDRGWLMRVSDGRNHRLAGVSFPYARPEVVLFIERLSAQYRNACGERLVVTSLTRPKTHQPPNASSRSVHPTGMALDLRRSRLSKCRRWLERNLMTLERRSVLEATYERRPPHYHVALFPNQYQAYVEAKLASRGRTHRVRRGETLWSVARRYGTTVSALRRENGIRSDRLVAGQSLKLPN